MIGLRRRMCASPAWLKGAVAVGLALIYLSGVINGAVESWWSLIPAVAVGTPGLWLLQDVLVVVRAQVAQAERDRQWAAVMSVLVKHAGGADRGKQG